MSKLVKLVDLCIKITDGSHYSPQGIDKGYPMFSSKDMQDFDFDFSQCKYISANDYKKMVENDCKPLVNDVLIIKDGNSYLQKVFVIREERECAILSSIGVLRPNTLKLNPYYLKYYLSSEFVKKEVAKKYVTGSALPRIILKNFGNIEIPYIDLCLQEKAVSILKLIDLRIENNNKVNVELESMAKTIYAYWFLQFPDENGKPYKSSGGKMVWNEELKKDIPEGWEVKKLMNLCSFSNGINYDKDIIGDKEYKIINVRNITTSSMLLDSGDFDKISLLSSQAEKYIVKPDDILIARSGSPGATRLLISGDENIIFCGFIIRCSPNEKKWRLFLAHTLKKLEGSNATKTGGSIMQNVSQETLKQINVCLPSDDIIDKYNNIIASLINKMQEIILENQELNSLRNFLLPLLMNGQVSFK